MGNVRSYMSENTNEITPNTMEAPTEAATPSQNMDDLYQEMESKREKRRQILAEKRQEMLDLRQQVEMYKEENEALKRLPDHSTIKELKEENEELKLQLEKIKILVKNSEDIASKNKELRICIAEMQAEVQSVNTELVNIEQERLEYAKHISALKDVVRVTKNMLDIRENQIQDLKSKVTSVEELLASKEMKIMSDGLREEYEKQLRNIRNLRVLYEERQRIDKKDKEQLQAQLDESKKLLEDEKKQNIELQERITELESDNSTKYDSINSLQSNLGLSKAECRELQGEIAIINQLFSEVLLGFNSTQGIDLDRLIKIFKENHDLLTNIVANEESDSTAAALPKLLLDLVNQTNKDDDVDYKSVMVQEIPSAKLNSAEEIAENLPKVWRVLIELLSHQTRPSNELSGDTDPCYTSVETPTGPKLKLSVSQTYIRLKDLILEKKFLEREMYRMKHLNTHLECRLQDQEKRLELVSSELSKTWHTVGKMQRQHQQLHTHEKVIRYELQQKRKLLTELKEELQECREKWVLARQKNDCTQKQWKELRKEFAARKVADDFNQSAESGYSDDKDSSEDEKGYESDVDLNEVKEQGEHSVDQIKTDLVQNSDERHNEILPNSDDAECSSSSTIIFNDTESPVRLEDQDSATASSAIDQVTITENVSTTSQATGAVPKQIKATDEVASTTNLRPNFTDINTASTRTSEEILARREERLKRLEEQCKQLVSKVTKTSERSINICNKLDDLHEAYGPQEGPKTDDCVKSIDKKEQAFILAKELVNAVAKSAEIKVRISNEPNENEEKIDDGQSCSNTSPEKGVKFATEIIKVTISPSIDKTPESSGSIKTLEEHLSQLKRPSISNSGDQNASNEISSSAEHTATESHENSASSMEENVTTSGLSEKEGLNNN